MLKSKIVGKTVGIIILSRGGIMAIKEVVEDNGIIHRKWKIVKDNGLDSMRSRPLPLIMEHLPRDFSSHNLNLHIAVLPQPGPSYAPNVPVGQVYYPQQQRPQPYYPQQYMDNTMSPVTDV